MAPLYVVTYLAGDDLAPAGRGAEAGTWVNVAANAASAGSAAAGFLIESTGPARAFLGAGSLLAAAALTLAARRTAAPARFRRADPRRVASS